MRRVLAIQSPRETVEIPVLRMPTRVNSGATRRALTTFSPNLLAEVTTRFSTLIVCRPK